MSLSRSPNPIYPYTYTPVVSKIGIRDMIVLTLGATSDKLHLEDVFTLVKTLATWIGDEAYHGIMIRRIFIGMMEKLVHEKLIKQEYDETTKQYKFYLTPRGIGERDGALYAKDKVQNKWKSFSNLVMLTTT